MDDLLDRLVANVGVDRGVAEKAVGIILAFLLQDGPSGKVQALINQIPGADAVAQAAASEESFGMGGLMGGIMGVGTKLMASGLDTDQMKGVTQELLTYARSVSGDDAVNEIVASIPGLGQFI
jgi:hypothetical protein